MNALEEWSSKSTENQNLLLFIFFQPMICRQRINCSFSRFKYATRITHWCYSYDPSIYYNKCDSCSWGYCWKTNKFINMELYCKKKLYQWKNVKRNLPLTYPVTMKKRGQMSKFKKYNKLHVLSENSKSQSLKLFDQSYERCHKKNVA